MGIKIGRNDPCPCGSGKKYKKCCGSKSQSDIDHNKETIYFDLNRKIAYKGKIGQKRESLCKRYIAWKKLAFKKIETMQLEQASKMGKAISCHKGCSFCCMEYISASLVECEAIVYYLYHHEKALQSFLETYPQWRTANKNNDDLFKEITKLAQKAISPEHTSEDIQAYLDKSKLYTRQHLKCPFLNEDTCLIYDVRPFCCASIVSASPSDWCNPKVNEEPLIFGIMLQEFSIPWQFYYANPAHIIGLMPLLVYEILKGSYFYLSIFPGLNGLDKEATNDKEVREIIESYR